MHVPRSSKFFMDVMLHVNWLNASETRQDESEEQNMVNGTETECFICIIQLSLLVFHLFALFIVSIQLSVWSKKNSLACFSFPPHTHIPEKTTQNPLLSSSMLFRVVFGKLCGGFEIWDSLNFGQGKLVRYSKMIVFYACVCEGRENIAFIQQSRSMNSMSEMSRLNNVDVLCVKKIKSVANAYKT